MLDRSVNSTMIQVFGTLKVATGIKVATQCLENHGRIEFIDPSAVLSATEIKGSGTISTKGDLTVSSDSDLTVSLKGGCINVSGNLRFDSFGALRVLHGDYSAARVFFIAENTSHIRANRIDAPVEIEAFESFIGVENGNLHIERHCVAGDPIFYNKTGDLAFPGIATGGEDFIALAAGSIVGGGVDAGGGRIVIAAGVSFDVTDDDDNPDDGHIDCADCSGKYTINGPGAPNAGVGITGSVVSSSSVIVTCTGIAAVNGSISGSTVSTTTAGVIPTGIVVGGDVVASVGQAELYTSGGIVLQSNNVSGKTGVTTVYQNGAVLPAFITMNAVDSIDGEVVLVTEGELTLTALVQAKQGIKTYLQNGGTLLKPSKITAKNFFSSNGAVELITTGELAVSDSIDAKQKISTVLDTGEDFLCPSKIDTKQLSSQESFIELITSGDLKVDGTVTCNKGYFNTYKARAALKKRPTKIEITGTVKTSGNNVVLVSTGNIKTVDIDVSTTSPQHVGAGVSILSYEGVGVGGASTQFVIGGNANANGVNGNIKMDTTTGGGASVSEFFLFLHVKNEGNGGIKLQRRNAISVTASQSKAGAVVFDCKGGNVDFPTSEGTFAVNGAAGQSAGYIVINAKKLLANGTSLSANDSGSGLQHGILISANEINHGATAFQLTANGTGGPAGTDNVNYVYLFPENTISVSDTLDANNLRIFVTLPPAKDVTPGPMAIKGTGAVTLQANGTGSAVIASGYPMTFEGQTRIVVNGAQTVAAVSYRGPAGAEAGINLSGASLDITANGTNGANGGSILLKTSNISTAADTPINLTANASGTAGQGGFIGVEMTGLDETPWVLNALVLGGTASGKGGSINLVVPNLKASGTINASSRAQGNGGNITFNGKRLFLQGLNAKILADSEKGNAGGISIGALSELDEFKTSSGRISAVARNEDAQFTGLGGIIEVKAKNALISDSTVFDIDGARGSLLLDIKTSQKLETNNVLFTASAGQPGGTSFSSGGIINLKSDGITSMTKTTLNANAKGESGNGGKVTVAAGTSQASTLDLLDGTRINANAGTLSGNSQQISINAGGPIAVGDVARIVAKSASPIQSQDPNIQITTTDTFTMSESAVISADAQDSSNGAGGRVKIAAKNGTISGQMRAVGNGSGLGGEVAVNGENISFDSGQVTVSSDTGTRGRIKVIATLALKLNDVAKFISFTNNSDNAQTNAIELLSDQLLEIGPLASVSVAARPTQAGNGGGVLLSARDLKVSSIVRADGGLTGNGGIVRLIADQSFTLSDSAQLTARGGLQGGDGGELVFPSAVSEFTALAGSAVLIDTSARGGDGKAGDIQISLKTGQYLGDSFRVEANSMGSLSGGTISYSESDSSATPLLIRRNQPGSISFSANGGETGDGGSIVINCNQRNVTVLGDAVSALAGASGADGGSLTVNTLGSLTLGGIFDFQGTEAGDGGEISFRAEDALAFVLIGTNILATTGGVSGNGGRIQIVSLDPTDVNLGNTTIESRGGADAGNGGSIMLSLGKGLVIPRRLASSISAEAPGSNGNGGNVTIVAGTASTDATVSILGPISASSGRISGDAGTISITQNSENPLSIDSGGVVIADVKRGDSGFGNGGLINLRNASPLPLLVNLKGTISADNGVIDIGEPQALTRLQVFETGEVFSELTLQGLDVRVINDSSSKPDLFFESLEATETANITNLNGYVRGFVKADTLIIESPVIGEESNPLNTEVQNLRVNSQSTFGSLDSGVAFIDNQNLNTSELILLSNSFAQNLLSIKTNAGLRVRAVNVGSPNGSGNYLGGLFLLSNLGSVIFVNQVGVFGGRINVQALIGTIEFNQANIATSAVETNAFAGMAEFLAGAFIASEVNIIPDTFLQIVEGSAPTPVSGPNGVTAVGPNVNVLSAVNRRLALLSNDNNKIILRNGSRISVLGPA